MNFGYRRSNHESIKEICDELGYYHQCQNDFLDIFNIGGALNKTSNDIENGSVTWLAFQAYDRANAAQRKILVDNFGKKGTYSSFIAFSTYLILVFWSF